MIVLAALALIVSLGLTFLVFTANMMSDSPSTPFQGGWVLLIAWVTTVALWLGWWVG